MLNQPNYVHVTMCRMSIYLFLMNDKYLYLKYIDKNYIEVSNVKREEFGDAKSIFQLFNGTQKAYNLPQQKNEYKGGDGEKSTSFRKSVFVILILKSSFLDMVLL